MWKSFKKKCTSGLRNRKKNDPNEQERRAFENNAPDVVAAAVDNSPVNSGNEEVESIGDDGPLMGLSKRSGDLSLTKYQTFEHQIMGIRNEDVWTVVGVWDGYNKFEPKEELFCGVSTLTIDGLKSEKRQEILESGAIAVFCVCVGVGIVYWRWKKLV